MILRFTVCSTDFVEGNTKKVTNIGPVKKMDAPCYSNKKHVLISTLWAISGLSETVGQSWREPLFRVTLIESWDKLEMSQSL